MSNFPASVDSFTTKTNFTTTIDAADVNTVQAAVVAIESSLLGQTASTMTPSAISTTATTATSATFTTATITTLNATNSTASNSTVTTATITGLTATSATATSVTATSASISAATVTTANFAVGPAGTQASFPTLRENEVFAMKPQVVQAYASTVTGTTNTTGVMMGLATTITPQITGRLFVQVSGDILNSTAIADGGKLQLRAGTGSAPTNASTTLSGSTISGLVTYVAATTAEKAPFGVQGIATGLAAGTTVWIDLSLAAVTGGTATIENVSVSAFEL